MGRFLAGMVGRSAYRVMGAAWLLAGTVASAQAAADVQAAAASAPDAQAPDVHATTKPKSGLDPTSIVVTGNPERKAVIKRMTTALSRQHDRQLARFDGEVCFQVGGLNAPYDRIMAERMEQDARDAGVAVGKPGCRPNIVVVLADHVQGELERLAREGHTAISLGLEDKDLKQSAQGPGPAYVVTVTEQRSRDGNRLWAGKMGDLGDRPMMIVHDASIINPPTRQDIVTVLVGIETAATMGKTLAQLADYAALRSLADIKGAAAVAGAEPTILGLFNGSPGIMELTSYDRAYLKGLYHGPAAVTATTRMHEIVTAATHKPAQ
ncbi:hypothetical protein [Novosphingobium terrae]|uniref:hypothetical protein n=1 Tax=Novosphingobium terrae TaxID=2726189 RepID=UPI00197FEF0B|nr:hypothetical protein [Novosphingobium terrae]